MLIITILLISKLQDVYNECKQTLADKNYFNKIQEAILCVPEQVSNVLLMYVV